MERNFAVWVSRMEKLEALSLLQKHPKDLQVLCHAARVFQNGNILEKGLALQCVRQIRAKYRLEGREPLEHQDLRIGRVL